LKVAYVFLSLDKRGLRACPESSRRVRIRPRQGGAFSLSLTFSHQRGRDFTMSLDKVGLET
jgi:hypothetical protein